MAHADNEIQLVNNNGFNKTTLSLNDGRIVYIHKRSAEYLAQHTVYVGSDN